MLGKDAENTEEDQDGNDEMTFFPKMREQNLVKRKGKNPLDCHMMNNLKDYNSQIGIKSYACR